MKTTLTILRDYHIGVAAAEFVHMLDGVVQTLDHLDARLQRAVLVLHRLGRRRSKGERLIERGPREQGDALTLEHVAHVREERARHEVLVDEKRLHGVAGCAKGLLSTQTCYMCASKRLTSRIVTLGVANNLQCRRQVSVLVHVHMANTLRMAQHRNVQRLLLDAAHQLGRSTRNDQVNVFVHGQQIADLLAGGHQRNGFLGADGGQRLLHQFDERLVTVRRLLAALQQKAVGRGHGQRGDLGQRIGARLEDHQQHADRDGDLGEV